MSNVLNFLKSSIITCEIRMSLGKILAIYNIHLHFYLFVIWVTLRKLQIFFYKKLPIKLKTFLGYIYKISNQITEMPHCSNLERASRKFKKMPSCFLVDFMVEYLLQVFLMISYY